MNGKTIFSRFNKFYHGFAFAIILILAFIVSCDGYYMGKSREEINQELSEIIFETDSILLDLKWHLDSLEAHKDFNK